MSTMLFVFFISMVTLMIVAGYYGYQEIMNDFDGASPEIKTEKPDDELINSLIKRVEALENKLEKGPYK